MENFKIYYFCSLLRSARQYIPTNKNDLLMLIDDALREGCGSGAINENDINRLRYVTASRPIKKLLQQWLDTHGMEDKFAADPTIDKLSLETAAILLRDPSGFCDNCGGPIWTHEELEESKREANELWENVYEHKDTGQSD